MVTDYAKYSNIEYVMPFLFCNDLYIPLLQEFYKDEINPVKYVYGGVNTVWSGGRNSDFIPPKMEIIKGYLGNLKKYNVTAALTFSNYFVTKEQLNDEFCNQFLDIAYEHNCHFIVSSEKLYNHIKKMYPNAQMICSVIAPSILRAKKDFDETEFYKKMLDKYEVVVTTPEWTLENINNLGKIISDTERLEVLVNQICQYNCPNCRKHYYFVGKLIRNEIVLGGPYKRKYLTCKRPLDYRPLEFNEQQIQTLIESGVKKLKLQGRTETFDVLYKDIYKYCINSKYTIEEIRNKFDFISAKLIQKSKVAAVSLI